VICFSTVLPLLKNPNAGRIYRDPVHDIIHLRIDTKMSFVRLKIRSVQSVKSYTVLPAGLRLVFLVSVLLSLQFGISARPQERNLTLAVLDFGDSTLGQLVAEKLASSLKRETGIVILDRDQARAAARGAGYAGSINLSLSEARDLGAALGCDFFILGDAQTVRRSPSAGPAYFESYGSIFLVSARTGRLVGWERPNFRAASATAAERSLLSELGSSSAAHRSVLSIRRAQEIERGERALTVEQQVPIIEEAPDDEKRAESEGLRLPRPYRRLAPKYPDSAALAETEATVDVLVDLDVHGEVTRVEVARWAGFGLDETAIDTARQLHFFPAMRNGVAIPLRVLLRYNFRKPPR
jgi:TonB family protein